MAYREDEDAARRREAGHILKRIGEETDPQTGTHVQSWLLRPRAFFKAEDADQDDRIEVIGMRIGRLLGVAGLLVFAALFLIEFAA
ncbi:hypothetical protein DYI37_07255 [Fulvimarina endophytica]|uniref:Uncharacterized protein n=1 Tax=Fulvimarina endophytica TaxID=2293836 RepID=A0A371X4K7_9HYPH|nr:hypothetical protein [Fulvimarina endophytica]RFC64150.1 hypothetical protein DYI37_07255 [Fulvimarina endophytica]